MDRPTPLMLKEIILFRGLSEAELERLAADMWIENRRKGELLSAGSPFVGTAWFVFRGIVELYTITRQGGRKILFFQGPGRLLNMNVTGSSADKHLGRAAADTMLLCMDRDILARHVLASPILIQALFAHYETKLWRLSHQLKNTAGSVYIERKFSAKLLKLAADFGKSWEEGTVITFDLTITQMADYIGVPRESASRACRKLQELGLVRYENRRFYIPDIKKLSDFRREVKS